VKHTEGLLLKTIPRRGLPGKKKSTSIEYFYYSGGRTTLTSPKPLEDESKKRRHLDRIISSDVRKRAAEGMKESNGAQRPFRGNGQRLGSAERKGAESRKPFLREVSSSRSEGVRYA